MIPPTTPSNPSPLSTPPRSTTLPAKPAHKHHHPHRVHNHHHDKSVPQSAILPATSNPFGDFLPKTSSRVDGNKTPPRGAEQRQQGNERVNEVKEMEKERRDEESETWKQVERLRATRNAVDDDFRTRLSTLSTLSTTTTRRLDYTYYSLLSSLSSLTSTISSLSSLSAQISTMQTHFTSSSSSLTSEITSQIASSSNSFDAQARRIYQLETRIKEGRRKVARLGERLDGVRDNVERSSLRDRETRRIVGRRWKMLWGFLGFFTGLFVILATTRQWRRNEYAITDEVVHSVNRTEEVFKEVVGFRENGEQKGESRRDDEGVRPGAKTRIGAQETTATSSVVDADVILRLFDEL